MIKIDADWMDHAECARPEHRSVRFFPPDCTPAGGHEQEPAKRQRERTALAVCGACPVAEECLRTGLIEERQSFRHGVRGGMTPDQRETFVRTGRRPAVQITFGRTA